MKEIYSSISNCIYELSKRKRLILYKNEDELKFLKEWLHGVDEDTIVSEPVSMESLTEMIRSCRRCENITERKIGYGTGENGILIILNAPKMIDYARKRLLKTDSVALLKKMNKAIDVDLNACYTTNMIKCDSLDPMNSPSRIFPWCEGFLIKELAIIKPKIALVLGEIVPLQRIINSHQQITWYNIEHPITLLKNPDLKRKAWETLKLVMARLKELDML